ncbi:glycosyltransferase family 4 protein [Quadrisphaera sp. INWT6]|uniref:glycosyltransferase family 4 protein n=1 Tax=Quadrisphaera sp. INWT6 TaxID=2596917 RepID=UPI0018927AE3|nr:glycosyltransferase family 4 protein [Quadrisphaera sp. INWT6]MBF5082097.1 glycosyltransferase family 4 protein [Quadrisphaera sp. INWT6]
MSSGATLVVTNDFPPRAGGIESFVLEVVRRLPGRVVVHTKRQDGDAAGAAAQAEVDAELAAQGVVVVRDPARLLLPTPALARRVAATAREHGCDRAWFGAAAPLGLLAPALRRAGVRRTAATTYGHEVWWARLPVSRALLRRIVAVNDAVTVLGEATGAPIVAALPRRLRERVSSMPPGVEAGDFDATDPAVRAAAAEMRERWGVTGRPVVLCVSRLVERKGQDVLVRALPAVRAAVPGAALVLVGVGPRRARLERLVAELGLQEHVVLAGRAPAGGLAAAYAAGDVFAMPCRDLRGGLETEGLGIVFLEAAASGLPVVVGRSGGAPDAVQDGVTGVLVDGRDVDDVAQAVAGLLGDPDRAREVGAAGRAWVRSAWGWQERVDELAVLLEPR